MKNLWCLNNKKLHSKSWRSQSQHLSVVMLQYKINLSYLQEFTLSWCLEACHFFSSTRNTQQVTGKLLWVTSPAVPRYPLCCFITSRTWLEYKYGIFHALHAVWKTITWSPSRLADKWHQSTLLAMCVSVRARNSLSNFSCQIAADEPTIILLSPTGLISTCIVTLLSARR